MNYEYFQAMDFGINQMNLMYIVVCDSNRIA